MQSTILPVELKPFSPAPPADLDLCVVLVDSGADCELHFWLHSRALKYSHRKIGHVRLHRSPKEIMQAVHERLNQITGRAPKSPDDRLHAEKWLASISNDLWDELIPDTLKQEFWLFKNRAKSLLITSDEPWIPWELIKPYRIDQNGIREDTPFWCQQFSMSRWLSEDYGPADELFLGAARAVYPEQVNLDSVEEEISFLNDLNSLNSGISVLEPLHMQNHTNFGT